MKYTNVEKGAEALLTITMLPFLPVLWLIGWGLGKIQETIWSEKTLK